MGDTGHLSALRGDPEENHLVLPVETTGPNLKVPCSVWVLRETREEKQGNQEKKTKERKKKGQTDKKKKKITHPTTKSTSWHTLNTPSLYKSLEGRSTIQKISVLEEFCN